jgi:hypothetical protein
MLMLQVPVPPTPPSLPSPEILVGVGGAPSAEQLLVALGGAAVIVGIIFLGPVGRALADGLRHLLGARRGQDTAELDAIREEFAALRHQLAELEERQDFSERLLAQARERGLLSGPPSKE